MPSLKILSEVFSVTGRGGNGGEATAVKSTGTVIKGKVQAPAGLVPMFQKKGTLTMLASLLLPETRSDMPGLQPISQATVELIRVDSRGNLVGEVLVTAATDPTGCYTLTLPADVNGSSDLVVRVRGTHGSEMRAVVTGSTVNIDPLSHFLVQRVVDLLRTDSAVS